MCMLPYVHVVYVYEDPVRNLRSCESQLAPPALLSREAEHVSAYAISRVANFILNNARHLEESFLGF